MTSVPHGSEGPGPRTSRPSEPGETRHLALLTLGCIAAGVVVLGVIPWLCGAWT